MKVTIALGLLAMVGVALSKPQYRAPQAYHPAPSYNTVPNYAFNWASKDYNGNDFGHEESRDGYNTKGSYYVQLPDGRLQHVNYYVDGDSGYVAEVTYQGEAQYPAYQPAPAYRPAQAYRPSPAYRPAQVVYG